MRRSLFTTLGGIVFSATVFVAATGYHIIGEIKIGGEGGWDYLTVDSAARRLYVSHATHVVGRRSRREQGRRRHSRHAGRARHRDRAGAEPRLHQQRPREQRHDLRPEDAEGDRSGADRREPRSHPLRRRCRAACSRSTADRRTRPPSTRRPATVVGTIALPGKPEFSVADGKGKVYVNIEDTSEIVEIDAAKATVTKKYSLSAVRGAVRSGDRREEPPAVLGLRQPADGHLRSRRRQSHRDAGHRRRFRRRGFDPGTGYAFSSNGDGTLTVVQQTGGKWEVAREHRDRARRAHDRARREDPQASICRRRRRRLQQGGGRATICRTPSRSWSSANEDRDAAIVSSVGALVSGAAVRGAAAPPRRRRRCTLVQPDAPAAPPVDDHAAGRTRSRAKQNDAQFQTAVADAQIAREDRVQARAGAAARAQLHDAVSRQRRANGVNPNGRFVSLDGVNMYRAWGVAAPGTLARTTFMQDAAAAARRPPKPPPQARLEIAQRGLAVTVTRTYYALVTAQRKYATAQQPRSRRARFFDISAAAAAARPGGAQRRHQGRDPVPAAAAGLTRKRMLAMDTARLTLAVMLFPDARRELHRRRRSRCGAAAAAVCRRPHDGGAAATPTCAPPTKRCAPPAQDVRAARERVLPDARRRRGVRHRSERVRAAQPIAAQPELGVLPNLGYFITVNLTVPVWDWGGLRSKLHQSADARSGRRRSTLTQAQRQMHEQPLLDVQRSAGGEGRAWTACSTSPISPPKACA